jgi:hypothetical protein
MLPFNTVWQRGKTIRIAGKRPERVISRSNVSCFWLVYFRQNKTTKIKGHAHHAKGEQNGEQ